MLGEAIQVYDNVMEEKTTQKQDLIVMIYILYHQNECNAIEKQLKDKMEYFKVVDSERAREKQLEMEFKRKREVITILINYIVI